MQTPLATQNTVVQPAERVSKYPPLPSEQLVPRYLPKVLGRRDMFFMYTCALFLLTNAVLGASGGVVSLTYLILGALLFFIPTIVASAQLGILLPHEGSLYNWTYHALGYYWSFFVGLIYWVTGILALITGADAFVTIVQGLNNAWLTEPWQQGLIILLVITIGTLICLQRMRTTQNVINGIILALLFCVTLIVLGAVAWLLKGHAVQTNLGNLSTWSISPNSFFFFGIITLNFIGSSGPLNMAGEFKGAGTDEQQRRSIILFHLRWGPLFVFALYFVVTLSLLIVRGADTMNKAAVLPFEAFTLLDVSLAKIIGNIGICCFLLYCFASTIFYGMASSRVILAAAIDRRIPSWFGRLNRSRSPQNALLFQLFFSALIVVVVFIVAPYFFPFGGNATNTLVIIYNILSASLTLVWTAATFFFFVNLVFVYRNSPQRFRANRILPMSIIWLATIIGGLACLFTMIAILVYSWIPQLLQGSQWGLFVGGLALAVLIIAGTGSLFANTEASWEDMNSGAEAQSGDNSL